MVGQVFEFLDGQVRRPSRPGSTSAGARPSRSPGGRATGRPSRAASGQDRATASAWAPAEVRQGDGGVVRGRRHPALATLWPWRTIQINRGVEGTLVQFRAIPIPPSVVMASLCVRDRVFIVHLVLAPESAPSISISIRSVAREHVVAIAGPSRRATSAEGPVGEELDGVGRGRRRTATCRRSPGRRDCRRHGGQAYTEQGPHRLSREAGRSVAGMGALHFANDVNRSPNGGPIITSQKPPGENQRSSWNDPPDGSRSWSTDGTASTGTSWSRTAERSGPGRSTRRSSRGSDLPARALAAASAGLPGLRGGDLGRAGDGPAVGPGDCEVVDWGEDRVRLEVRGAQLVGLVELRRVGRGGPADLACSASGS